MIKLVFEGAESQTLGFWSYIHRPLTCISIIDWLLKYSYVFHSSESESLWICGVLGRPPSGVWHQGSARCLVAAEGQFGAGGAGHLEGSRAEPLFKAV